jgi:hypothetical protein
LKHFAFFGNNLLSFEGRIAFFGNILLSFETIYFLWKIGLLSLEDRIAFFGGFENFEKNFFSRSADP